jgi:hypothetical protein
VEISNRVHKICYFCWVVCIECKRTFRLREICLAFGLIVMTNKLWELRMWHSIPVTTWRWGETWRLYDKFTGVKNCAQKYIIQFNWLHGASPSWEAYSHSPIYSILWNPKINYRVHKSPPILMPCVTFRNKLDFYGEELLAPRPTPTLEVDLSVWVFECHVEA